MSVRKETQCEYIEISDPGRITATQRLFLGQLTNERPGKGSKFVTALFTVFVICEQGIYHLMPRIPAIVITVTHSLFGCDHWVTTDFIIAVLKKLRCLNCLSNVAQVCNNDKAASSVKIRLDSENNLS